jgi:vacuolar-type H+-ATPase subunit H
MTDRQEIQRELEEKISQGEAAVNKLKAKMSEAGHEASEESRKALDAAENLLNKGKAKYEELAKASDEEFDELWGKTKENWDALSSGIEQGWDAVSEKVRRFFS